MRNLGSKIHIGDIDIYTSEIRRLVDEYIETLHDPKVIYSQNKMYFNGMLKYVYHNYFVNNTPDTSDIDLLNDLWTQYTNLCYEFGKKPTITWFCFFTGIQRETVLSWLDGTYKNTEYMDENGEPIDNYVYWKQSNSTGLAIGRASLLYTNLAKKWYAECENALCDSVTDQNSIGSMFILKSKYGYRETAPIPAPESRQVTIAAADLPKLSQSDFNITEVSQIAQNDDKKERESVT